MKRIALSLVALAAAVSFAAGPEIPPAAEELRVWKVPNVPEGAECYFSPDGRSLIFNGKMAGDRNHQVYTVRLDGSELRRINDRGVDACSFFRPDGVAVIGVGPAGLARPVRKVCGFFGTAGFAA